MHEYALLREHEAPGLSRGLSKMTLSSLQGTGTARDFIRLLTVELHKKDREKTGLPDLPIKGPMKTAK
jgi:hypothetical protein